jgi:hypothetical protein
MGWRTAAVEVVLPAIKVFQMSMDGSGLILLRRVVEVPTVSRDGLRKRKERDKAQKIHFL